MIRRCYLVALCVLQVMLAWQLVPVIAIVLTRHVPLGRAADGFAAVAEIACAAMCVIGAGLTLAYPCIAIMRHVQRGEQRFSGLPQWALIVMFTGAAFLALDAAIRALGVWLPSAEQRALAMALPLAAPGVALMSAGALFAELLRRTRPNQRRAVPSLGPIVRLRREPRLVEADSACSLERVA